MIDKDYKGLKKILDIISLVFMVATFILVHSNHLMWATSTIFLFITFSQMSLASGIKGSESPYVIR